MQRRSFYPPQLNAGLVQLLQGVAPGLIRWRYQLELVLSTEPHVKLASLRDAPCLFLCNHPTFHDPIVLFLFSGLIQRPFYYLAARERFGGLEGWLLQQIGAYSIRRGYADRDSVAQSLQLLGQPDCKLVIFPEGGCSFQNDTVMPFRPGAVQMALQASRQSSQQSPTDFYLVPLSLKYRYSGQVQPMIERTLRRLEQALGVEGRGNFYDRLRLVAAAVLRRFEQEYQLSPSLEADWNQRIAALKAQILSQCEALFNITAAAGESNRERVYRIQRAIETRDLQAETEAHPVLYNGNDDRSLRRSLSRVLNFDAIYDGYVAEHPTPERFLDTLTRLEREVFEIDQPPAKGHRQAFLRVGQPINLREQIGAYKTNRAITIRELTQQLHQTIQHNLDVLSEATARDISW